MIIDAGDPPPDSIMFLRGFRAPAGGAVYVPADDSVTHQEVGAFVARSRLNFDGSLAAPGPVATEDVPYADMPAQGPFRYEADIAASKPDPDVVVVDAVDAVLTPVQLAPFVAPYNDADSAAIDALIAGAAFGTVEIDRGAGFGAPLARPFGWLARGDSPGRRDDAGIEGGPGIAHQLTEFDGERYKLPDGYGNAFQNGGPLPGEAAFVPGDRLRFTDNAGPVTVATVPAAPSLAVTQDGAPLDPPLSLTPLVDTVVMDRGTQEFLFVWRATFAWEPRFETATLEVS